MVDTAGDARVAVTVSDHVATVELNRPEVLNAIDTPAYRELLGAFEQLSTRSDVWCVVLRGAGRAFSVGADQRERSGMSDEAIRQRRALTPQVFAAIHGCAHPVIAQVHGYALGGGLELALCADIVVAAEDAQLGLIETTLGAIPAGGGSQLLPRLIGAARAKELIFTGRRICGSQALEWGMVSYATPSEDLDSTVAGLSREICAAVPVANTQAKRAINLSLDVDVRSGLQAEAALYERVLHSSDRREALQARREKRAPNFTGE